MTTSTTPPDDVPPQAGPHDRSAVDVPGETPSEQRATATWVGSTDASGEVKATRSVPEPDSPGG